MYKKRLDKVHKKRLNEMYKKHLDKMHKKRQDKVQKKRRDDVAKTHRPADNWMLKTKTRRSEKEWAECMKQDRTANNRLLAPSHTTEVNDKIIQTLVQGARDLLQRIVEHESSCWMTEQVEEEARRWAKVLLEVQQQRREADEWAARCARAERRVFPPSKRPGVGLFGSKIPPAKRPGGFFGSATPAETAGPSLSSPLNRAGTGLFGSTVPAENADASPGPQPTRRGGGLFGSDTLAGNVDASPGPPSPLFATSRTVEEDCTSADRPLGGGIFGKTLRGDPEPSTFEGSIFGNDSSNANISFFASKSDEEAYSEMPLDVSCWNGQPGPLSELTPERKEMIRKKYDLR